jgi:hypothetical protein
LLEGRRLTLELAWILSPIHAIHQPGQTLDRGSKNAVIERLLELHLFQVPLPVSELSKPFVDRVGLEDLQRDAGHDDHSR